MEIGELMASMDVLRPKLKQALLLWLDGFRDACCLHRVIIYCLRSRQLAIRTGQCFLLNGLIFLGSIFLLNSVIVPTLQWILPDQCPHTSFQEPCLFDGISKLYSFLRHGLLQVFYVFWFYPLYIFSFILSNMWYNDIAKYGFLALEKHEPTTIELPSKQEISSSSNATNTDKHTDLGGIMIGIAEQVYSVVLLNLFFLEVQVTGFIPYVGKTLNFLLLSWMYKWNLSGLSLDKRLDFFESNWAFFAGFGNPCVLAAFFFSPLVSYGVMAILFPLFVLTAAGSDADKLITSQRRKWKGAGLGRLPIFYAADYLSMRVLSFFPLKPREPIKVSKAL
ncbi:protein EI24 homolog isoform X2 [Actinidia eriantha]|uniref:protein EI24 homolog isoform X2 n=1 Tax=Actinidia eriantha TaxID=165200 RepID=UPI00258CCF75|nr:protein EI24 homolog isoform X2 [Actinidia eriantha]